MRVDFPDPLAPMMPIVLRAQQFRDTSSSTGPRSKEAPTPTRLVSGPLIDRKTRS